MGVVGHEGGAVESAEASLVYRRWFALGSDIKHSMTVTGVEPVYRDEYAQTYVGPNPMLPAFPPEDATVADGYPLLPAGFTYTGDGYYRVQLALSRGTVTGGGYWPDENPTPSNYRLHWGMPFRVWRMRVETSPGVRHRASVQAWHTTADVPATHATFDADDLPYPTLTWVPTDAWTWVNDFTGVAYDAGFTVPIRPYAEETWGLPGGFLQPFDYTWPVSFTLSVQPFAAIQHPNDEVYPPIVEGGASLYGLSMDLTALGGVRQVYNQGLNTTALRLRSSDDGAATFTDVLLPFSGHCPDVLCLPDGRLWVFEETDGIITGHGSDDEGGSWT